MVKNYFKTAFRNLIKYKGYSFINITGLALGIACCLLIILYVKDELTFDRFHKNGEHIYRMQTTLEMNDNQQVFNAVGLPAGPTMQEALPEITEQARYVSSAMEMRLGEKTFNEGEICYVEPQFLDIFNFPAIAGNGEASLQTGTELVMTKQAALKYFGDSKVTGREIEVKINDQWKTFTVGAVLRDIPSNSTINFNVLLPFQTYLTANNRQSNNANDWGRIELGFQTFIVTADGVQKDSLAAKINKERFARMEGPMAQMIAFDLQGLHEMHWDASISNGDGMRDGSNKVYSWLLSGIAFVILMLACINFTNLSVARALPRAKEIGVRKVVGAARKQLINQFLSEALFVSMIAFVLGLLIAQLALPAFETATQKEFSVAIIDDPLYIAIAFIVVLIAAFIAGIYPALMISRFNTVSALKGSIAGVGRKNWLQKVLVVLQFTIAGFMIIAVMTMNRQISYMINADKGYDDSNLLQVHLNLFERTDENGQISGEGERMLNLLKNELAGSPSIEYVTGKSRGLSMTMSFSLNEETGERQQVRTFMDRADPDFFKALGMEILEGRNFNLENGEAERDYIIVNQQFAKKMNWGDSVLGRKFGFDNSQQEVIGLVKDYNFQSLESEIDPIVVNLRKDQSIGTVLVKFREGTLATSLKAVEAAWQKFNPVAPFEYELLSEVNANQYGNQERWRSILLTASFIAIAISCLGLFGLAYMAMQRRTKEIGVRKVLGAPVPKIIYILSRSFSALVLVSFIIACPLAYYGAEEWLSTFPYRITMGWDMFVIAGLVTMFVAILTVSFHAVRTAISNPVKALRYE